MVNSPGTITWFSVYSKLQHFSTSFSSLMRFFTGCNFTDLVEFYRPHHSLWQKQQQFLANKAQDDTVSFLQGHRWLYCEHIGAFSSENRPYILYPFVRKSEYWSCNGKCHVCYKKKEIQAAKTYGSKAEKQCTSIFNALLLKTTLNSCFYHFVQLFPLLAVTVDFWAYWKNVREVKLSCCQYHISPPPLSLPEVWELTCKLEHAQLRCQ